MKDHSQLFIPFTYMIEPDEEEMKIVSATLHFNWHRIYDSDTHHVVPSAPGIYIFVECDFDLMTKRIVYVGMSLNLQKRLCMSTHHAYFKWLMKYRHRNKVLLRYFMPTEDCVEKELRYIKKFSPFLNVRDNCEV
jgi:deoxyadenosine/deoxycytidine kinase